MNKKETKQEERGQSLVLVALAMIGLIAFAGLALDGGLAYATRRVAQNAADSGAIAGIYELHEQKSASGFSAGQLDEEQILSDIHQVVESHGVPDTDDTPGNHINDNVRAFYVSRGAGGGSCSNAVGTGYEELCPLDGSCNATDVKDRAVGISIEVDMPFKPIFAGVIGWDEIEVSNRSFDFDQRTAAIVHAKDRGLNSDLWAIFAMSLGTTSGPSTFIQTDPAFQPPVGFASANVHSQGSFVVGNETPPIMGQVTYCTTGGCSNCFNALFLPEQTQKTINLPSFTEYTSLAQQRAAADNTAVTDDIEWGAPLTGPPQFVQGVQVITGTLTIPESTWVATPGLFVYVTGDVNIDGFFNGTDVTIMSGGTITVNGTFRNLLGPYSRNEIGINFSDNTTVLWSNRPGGIGINVTGTLVNQPSDLNFSNVNSDIRGAIIASNSDINIDSNNINTTVRGTVIGNVVWANSSPDTLSQTNIQYNGNYFPYQPDRIELLK